ncbi:hypothetical protein [Vibrio crassostreae]|nr:hypothetical protein [Vibrio crassostreae]
MTFCLNLPCPTRALSKVTVEVLATPLDRLMISAMEGSKTSSGK